MFIAQCYINPIYYFMYLKDETEAAARSYSIFGLYKKNRGRGKEKKRRADRDREGRDRAERAAVMDEVVVVVLSYIHHRA